VGIGGREQSFLDNSTTNPSNNVTGPGTPVIPLKMEGGSAPGVGFPIGLDQNNMNRYIFDSQGGRLR
jgi:hypothetical protein